MPHGSYSLVEAGKKLRRSARSITSAAGVGNTGLICCLPSSAWRSQCRICATSLRSVRIDKGNHCLPATSAETEVTENDTSLGQKSHEQPCIRVGCGDRDPTPTVAAEYQNERAQKKINSAPVSCYGRAGGNN
jgi:hypothetical protein